MDTKKLTTLDSSESVERVVEVVKRDGGVIIANFISDQDLQALKAELDVYLNETPYGEDVYFAGAQTRRVARLIARSDEAMSIALHPPFIESAQKILQTPN
jgi:hypothetical protein